MLYTPLRLLQVLINRPFGIREWRFHWFHGVSLFRSSPRQTSTSPSCGRSRFPGHVLQLLVCVCFG